MAFSYRPLWQLWEKMGVTSTIFKTVKLDNGSNILSQASITNMRKGESIALSSIDKFIEFYNDYLYSNQYPDITERIGVSDIVRHVPDAEPLYNREYARLENWYSDKESLHTAAMVNTGFIRLTSIDTTLAEIVKPDKSQDIYNYLAQIAFYSIQDLEREIDKIRAQLDSKTDWK